MSRSALAALGRLVTVVVVVAAYAAVLQSVYVGLITGPFAYAGYTYVAPSWQDEVSAALLTTGVAVLLPQRTLRISHVVLWLLFGICVAPAMLMVGWTGYVEPSSAGWVTLLLGAAFLVPVLGVRRDDPASTGPAVPSTRDDVVVIRGRRVSREALTWILCAAYSAATYGVMAATVGFSFHFVAIGDVYDVRAAYVDDLSTGGPLGYLLSGQAYIVNVYVIARALARRNIPLLGLAILGQFVLYSTTGFKTILFSIPAIVAVFFALRGIRRRRGVVLLAGPLLMVVISAVVDALRGDIELTGLLTRRFIVTPGLLTSVYVDYFSQNPVALWAKSFTRFWVESPYTTTPTKLVGQYMLPGSSINANANLFADGFANLGPIGVVLIAGVLLVWLRLLDRCSAGVPMPVLGALFVMSAVTLSNTSILTAMLSHGLAFGTLLVAVAPRSGWSFLAGRETIARQRRRR